MEIFTSSVPIIMFIIDSEVQSQSLPEFIILSFLNECINQDRIDFMMITTLEFQWFNKSYLFLTHMTTSGLAGGLSPPYSLRWQKSHLSMCFYHLQSRKVNANCIQSLKILSRSVTCHLHLYSIYQNKSHGYIQCQGEVMTERGTGIMVSGSNDYHTDKMYFRI